MSESGPVLGFGWRPTPEDRASPDELAALGRGLRERLPRRAHAVLAPADRDPLAILAEQNATRLPTLVPVRMERMAADPFAFYRGTAALMAFDLAREPSTGLEVILCGDAHIANFGLYASPQRTLVFDLNDFDEAGVGPWEWDVKRFVTSVVIGARANAYPDRDIRDVALRAAGGYREALRAIAPLHPLARYYHRADADAGGAARRGRLSGRAAEVLEAAIRDARRRTAARFLERSAEVDASGRLRLIDDPPVLTHLAPELEAQVEGLLAQYAATVPLDIALLLGQYTIADVARRVVGVGSVGTSCFVIVLTAADGAPIVLQVKEAPPSVLNSHGGLPGATDAGAPVFVSNGHRVVTGQRILQAVSDPFLGYFSAEGRDFYVRQFRDQKGSIETAGLGVPEFVEYVQACADRLARAHAQSPAASAIAAYLGGGDVFDRAVVEWALGYEERSLADYRALVASRSG